MDTKEIAKGAWTEDVKKHGDKEYYWKDSGYRCSMSRTEGGYWYAFVTLPVGHPLLGKNNRVDGDAVKKFTVHGGITHIGNVSIGFHMAHPGDAVPLREGEVAKDSVYRDFDYVQIELESLVKQLINYVHI